MTTENTVKHLGDGVGSVVANHHGGGGNSMVVTTLTRSSAAVEDHTSTLSVEIFRAAVQLYCRPTIISVWILNDLEGQQHPGSSELLLFRMQYCYFLLVVCSNSVSILQHFHSVWLPVTGKSSSLSNSDLSSATVPSLIYRWRTADNVIRRCTNRT